jgi:hypothetical protein
LEHGRIKIIDHTALDGIPGTKDIVYSGLDFPSKLDDGGGK